MKSCSNSILFLIIGLLAIGCKDVDMQLRRKPHAYGKAGKLYVLSDSTTYTHAVADTLDYYFGAAFPILPQPEPLFDLIHYDYKDLVDNVAKQHLRAYLILANMEDVQSPITKMVKKDIGEKEIQVGLSKADYLYKVGRDKWAVNQLLIYIIGRDESALIDGIKAGVAPLSKRLYAFDGEQYEVNLFHGGHQTGIESKIEEVYDVHLDVPKRFAVGVDDPPFLWLQDYIPDVTGGVMLYRLDYHDAQVFTPQGMMALRDSLTTQYVQGPSEGSYMYIDTATLPIFHYQTEVAGQYATELRGHWEMSVDFMGGAFISYVIMYPDQSEVLFIDAFVFGPGKDKREPMKQLDYLVRKVTFLK